METDYDFAKYRKERKKATHALVAAKISTLFALVARLKIRAKHAVNATKMPRRASMLETK